MSMIIYIALLAVVITVISQVLPGIYLKNFTTAIFVAVIYSIINYFLGWLLVLLTLPAVILTLGLFKLIINGVLLWITDQMISDFKIKNFSTTLIAAVLITVADFILHKVVL